jgi:hypothetical protein
MARISRPNTTTVRFQRSLWLPLALSILLAGCAKSTPPPPGAASSPPVPPATGTPSSPRPSVPSQAPVPAESNPPGDIPDNTVFVAYRSPAGRFLVKVPEGWSRRSVSDGVQFSSHLNAIAAKWGAEPSAPTVASTEAVVVPALRSSTLAFQLESVKAVRLPGGPAIETVYQVNSKPNAVTGRQYRMVVERFEFFRRGKAVVLSLSSAVGSDNVDPWRTVSESYRWT